jgi:hypothetical protein
MISSVSLYGGDDGDQLTTATVDDDESLLFEGLLWIKIFFIQERS